MVVFLIGARGTKQMSMAHKFLFSTYILCGNNVEPQSLSSTMFLRLEGHCLRSSEGDDGTNGVRNFTSLNGSLLG